MLVFGAFALTPAHASTTAKILAPTAITGLEAADGRNNCLPSDTDCEKLAVTRHARCLWLEQQATSQPVAQSGGVGNVGYVFAVTPGHVFTLRPATGSSGDFDITFYIGLGTCGNRQRDPIGGTDPTPPADADHDAYSQHHFGDEAGTVPAGSTVAIVTLFGSANQSFTYN